MKIDWTTVVENLTIVLSVALVGAFILTAGWFIGAANAHNDRTYREYVMACIDKGGDIKYIPEVGKVCSTD